MLGDPGSPTLLSMGRQIGIMEEVVAGLLYIASRGLPRLADLFSFVMNLPKYKNLIFRKFQDEGKQVCQPMKTTASYVEEASNYFFYDTNLSAHAQ